MPARYIFECKKEDILSAKISVAKSLILATPA